MAVAPMVSVSPSAQALPTEEWRALIYLHRVDEISELMLRTEARPVVEQFERSDDPRTRSAAACLVGSIHAVAGAFADGEYWSQVAMGEAPASTWIAARITAVRANQLLWNGDIALAAGLFDEAPPIDHPLSNLGVWVAQARIAFARGDTARVDHLLEEIASDRRDDPLGIAAPAIASSLSSIALGEDRLDDAEFILRRALLTSTPGTRSEGLLVARLGHLMARRGLLRETDARRRATRAKLRRWPGTARGSERNFELLLSELGLRAHDGARGQRRATDVGSSGRRLAELAAEAESHIAARDDRLARHTIQTLLQALTEHVRPFESIEARSAAVRTLCDTPALAVGLGRLGDPADTIRIAQATMRVIVADQTRGPAAAHLADRLRVLADCAHRSDRLVLNDLEVIDLDHRIHRLGRGRHAPGSPLPSADWLEQPMPPHPLVLLEETGGHLWRATSQGDTSTLSDLGSIDVVERSVRAFRLAAVAIGLGHPEAEQRLSDAAKVLDEILFADCNWDDGERVTIVPGRVLPGLPWRLLPTLRTVLLTVAIGDRVSPPRTISGRAKVAVVRGPGFGLHEAPKVDAIAECYREATILHEPLLTPSRLIYHCQTAHVVHVVGHGRLGRSRFLARVDDDADDIRRIDLESIGAMADVAVFDSCDLTLNTELGRTGLAWLLIDNGVSHVIASSIDLDDEETAAIMPALHRRLATGEAPPVALHHLRFDDPRLQTAADSLVCFSIDPPA